MSAHHLVERVPLVEEYNGVRAAAGLGRRDPRAAEVGLPNNLSGVCVESEWDKPTPLLPPSKPPTGRPNKDHRLVLGAILWHLRPGA